MTSDGKLPFVFGGNLKLPFSKPAKSHKRLKKKENRKSARTIKVYMFYVFTFNVFLGGTERQLM